MISMIGYLLAGISLGLTAGFSPGPLFAIVIAQTLRHGLKEGMKAAVSPLITDIPIIFVCLFLLTALSAYKPILGMVSIVGAVFLLYLAYENLKTKEMAVECPAAEANSVFTGAAVNALSPHPYLFWLMVGGPMIMNAYEQGIYSAVIFIISFYFCLVGAKIMLAVAVNKSRVFLAGAAYAYTLKALGVLLIILAFILFKDGLHLLVP